MTRPLVREQHGPCHGAELAERRFLNRLLSRRVAGMLLRNTVVSTSVFAIGLGVLWLLVSYAGTDPVIAAGIGFLVSNSLHYAIGRAWIFRGSSRSHAAGYVYFLVNSAVGLFLTMALFAALTRYTSMHYLLARAVVSLFAGLAVFVLNAALNFRQV